MRGAMLARPHALPAFGLRERIVGEELTQRAGIELQAGEGLHSCPSTTSLARLNAVICSGFINPAWLSLCPANGRPNP